MEIKKVALGGGCHWCTEAVFLSLRGVTKVEQGFVSQKGEQSSFSEAIVVSYNPHEISLKELIEIHLHTHQSTSEHSFRNKYRSAVYVFSEKDFDGSNQALKMLQKDFNKELITKTYYFKAFKLSEEQFHNYYYSNPEKPFCKSYIDPKLKMLMNRYSSFMKTAPELLK
ncbi:peptide methionine sulfoxide reductase [Flagellimonas aquimarina]|uniref:peptide-methionine (S)-S-oxide reductase n=1 Tax=Flagellimonas aquimarina TaxID=2201895 RepID=A0A316KXZ2_9FLAO|nr:peptide-methionine (S)-S-oxide reductase [Allomuricauda koreensis]PWL38421.1 peptide methionine sulfoxide reductase [Allomuricauda koreensis]